MGLWVDDLFRGSDDGWDVKMGYLPETLVGRSRAKNAELGLQLETNDGVHHSLDVLLRKVTLRNLSALPRKIRLFFTHESERGGNTGRQPVGPVLLPGSEVLTRWRAPV